jgi:hypothetical protein
MAERLELAKDYSISSEVDLPNIPQSQVRLWNKSVKEIVNVCVTELSF